MRIAPEHQTDDCQVGMLSASLSPLVPFLGSSKYPWQQTSPSGYPATPSAVKVYCGTRALRSSTVVQAVKLSPMQDV